MPLMTFLKLRELNLKKPSNKLKKKKDKTLTASMDLLMDPEKLHKIKEILQIKKIMMILKKKLR